MKPEHPITNIFIGIMLVTVIAGYDIAHSPTPEVKAQDGVAAVSTPTPIAKSTTASDTIHFDDEVKQYVYEKFGDDYPKAFKIIECESRWNLRALNNNETWGGIGQDRGLWQINNKFHPISDSCAYDYKCSTDYAYKMYKNNNYSFIRWTCGRGGDK